MEKISLNYTASVYSFDTEKWLKYDVLEDKGNGYVMPAIYLEDNNGKSKWLCDNDVFIIKMVKELKKGTLKKGRKKVIKKIMKHTGFTSDQVLEFFEKVEDMGLLKLDTKFGRG